MPLNVSRRSLVLGSSALAASALLADRSVAQQATPVPAAPAASPGLARLIANENPYGPSERARRAVTEALPTAWQYPMSQQQVLKKLIATREGLSPQHVLLGVGSGEILQIAALVFGQGGGEVVAAVPAFGLLQDYAKQVGGVVTEVPLNDGLGHDLKGLAAAVTTRTRLLYVCNPNNPTGTLIPGGELRPFVQAMASRTTVLVDEAYLDLWEDWPQHTATERVRAGQPVIVTRTFSKMHGLAGLRIGYALAPPEVIDRLAKHQMTLLGCAGLAAATASYQDLEFQSFSRARLQESLGITTAALRELKLRHVENGRGNFVFFDTGGSLADFSAAMRSAGFQVGRPFPPYPSFSRVSMGTVPQMRGFADALRAYFT